MRRTSGGSLLDVNELRLANKSDILRNYYIVGGSTHKLLEYGVRGRFKNRESGQGRRGIRSILH